MLHHRWANYRHAVSPDLDAPADGCTALAAGAYSGRVAAEESRRVLAPIAAVLFAFIIVLMTVLGTGLGVGWLLHWLIPQVDLGLTLLIGVIAGAASVHFVARLIVAINSLPFESEREANGYIDQETGASVQTGVPPTAVARRAKVARTSRR